MADPQADEREAIAAAVQAAAPQNRPEALLVGWVVVAEWVDGNGARWLSRWSSETVTAWQMDGMLHHALYDPGWDSEGPDERAR